MRSRTSNISPAAPVAVGDQAGNGSAFGRDGAEAPGGGLGKPEGQADGNGSGHTEVPQARPASRRALKNWRVRSRLLLLITIPTLTAVALGGIRIASSVQSALAYQRVLQLTTLSSDITVLAQRLEDERDQTVYYIALGSANGRSALASPGEDGVARRGQRLPAPDRRGGGAGKGPARRGRRLVPGADAAGSHDRAVRD